jgi:hypothetical protein
MLFARLEYFTYRLVPILAPNYKQHILSPAKVSKYVIHYTKLMQNVFILIYSGRWGCDVYETFKGGWGGSSYNSFGTSGIVRGCLYRKLLHSKQMCLLFYAVI